MSCAGDGMWDAESVELSSAVIGLLLGTPLFGSYLAELKSKGGP